MLKKSAVENREICGKCGGACCKKSGCAYLPDDFKILTFEYLKDRLDKEDISVVACFSINTVKGKTVIDPILSLRAKNIGRPVIDLISKKNTCAQLNENGCKYSLDERPSEGAAQIPSDDFMCENPFSAEYTMGKWLKYQEPLKKLVEFYSGQSFKKELQEQIKKAAKDMAGELKDIGDDDELPEETYLLAMTLNYLANGKLRV